MSRLVQKGAARSKLHMEELKKTMARANYNLDSTQITEQLTTPTKNLETPISKPVTTSIEHFLDSRQQVRVSTNSKPSNKNLTLKEYIHLDSIEKSRKRKSVSSNSLMETGELIKGDKSLRVAKTRCNNLTSSQQMASQEFRYLGTFKEEINKQIEEQIKRLQDLSHFINHDYEAGTYGKKSERVLFCNIHSALTDEADLHKKLGEQILKIQEQDPQKLKRKNNKYFWETSHKQLTSPAKLKEGLEATGAAFMMFGLLETKGTDNK